MLPQAFIWATFIMFVIYLVPIMVLHLCNPDKHNDSVRDTAQALSAPC